MIFNLIRWKNLVLIALTQALVKYVLLAPAAIATTLDDLHFAVLVLATICIAAAGNIINDIYDVETDRINRPDSVIIGSQLSESRALSLFIILTNVGVGLGFYIANHVGNSGLATIFVIISALLYVYANYLKRVLLVGNLIISALVAMSLIVVGLFELLPAINPQNQEVQLQAFELIFYYAVFAFVINLLRELVKDIEDLEGDRQAGMSSLPTVIGQGAAAKLAAVLSLLPLTAVLYLLISVFYKQQLLVMYALLCIVGPLMYLVIRLFSAESKRDFHILSNVLKLVMFTGILSILLYPVI